MHMYTIGDIDYQGCRDMHIGMIRYMSVHMAIPTSSNMIPDTRWCPGNRTSRFLVVVSTLASLSEQDRRGVDHVKEAYNVHCRD